MGENSVLEPVDPQLGQYPAAPTLKAAARKPVAEVDEHILVLADQARKSMSQVRESVWYRTVLALPLPWFDFWKRCSLMLQRHGHLPNWQRKAASTSNCTATADLTRKPTFRFAGILPPLSTQATTQAKLLSSRSDAS